MDKEKAWLEHQAQRGLTLVDTKLFRYKFKECEPQDLAYEFDFQIMSTKDEPEYLEIMQDWTLAARYGGWYYFYRLNDGKNVELYNDNASRSSLFRRLLGFLLLTGFPLYYQLVILCPNLERSEFTLPSFYFFWRILVFLLCILHFYVLVRLFIVYKKFSQKLKE